MHTVTEYHIRTKFQARTTKTTHVCIHALHLLATDYIVTTNVPYKIVYLDSKLVTATVHGCNYNIQLDIRENQPAS